MLLQSTREFFILISLPVVVLAGTPCLVRPVRAVVLLVAPEPLRDALAAAEAGELAKTATDG